jgi:maleylacetoacetate isomerase
MVASPAVPPPGITMKLYSFFRSSAAYRARIALSLKGIPYETVPIHLPRGDQRTPEYRAINPHARVPALELDDGTVITQSLAIIDYLETTHPEPPVYPRDPVMRAQALAVALTITADIHGVAGLIAVAYLRDRLGQDEKATAGWLAHWYAEGFRTVEKLIAGGSFCFGDRPSVADICLVPQVFNARRFNLDLSAFPKIVATDAHLTKLPAFAKAHPSVQPDAE